MTNTYDPFLTDCPNITTAVFNAQKGTTETVLYAVYENYSYSLAVILALANNPLTPDNLLFHLANTTQQERVHKAIINNPTTPNALLRQYAQSNNHTLGDLAFSVALNRMMDGVN